VSLITKTKFGLSPACVPAHEKLESERELGFWLRERSKPQGELGRKPKRGRGRR